MMEWFFPGLIFLHLKDAPCAPYKLHGLASSHFDRDYADVMPNLRHLSLGKMAGFGEVKWTRNSQTLWLEMFLESRIAKQLLEVDLRVSGALAEEVRPAFNEAGFFDHSERENYWVRP